MWGGEEPARESEAVVVFVETMEGELVEVGPVEAPAEWNWFWRMMWNVLGGV